MTDDKRLSDPPIDIDWDEALAEWDTKSFAPQPAPEIVPEPKEAPAPAEKRSAASVRTATGAAAGPPRPALLSSWPDERAASAWLDETATATMAERAAWIEAEARLLESAPDRARALLTCSELFAALGEREHAHALALQARITASTLPLVHHQVRTLMPWPPDPEDYVESADAEAKASAPGPARTHSLLLAADGLHATGDDAAVTVRLDEALRSSPSDARAVLFVAARTLGPGGSEPAPLSSLPPELSPVRPAIDACRYLRNTDASAPPAGASFSNVRLAQARRALQRRDISGAVAALGSLRPIAGLDVGVRWLQAALCAATPALRPHAAELLEQLAAEGHEDARRPLLARALELGDTHRLADAMTTDSVEPAERLVLAALTSVTNPYAETDFALAARSLATRAVACAAASVTDAPSIARAKKVAGEPEAAARTRLGRLLACGAPADVVATAVSSTTEPASTRGVALELAKRAAHFSDLSRIVEKWGAARPLTERATGALAAALIAEAGNAMARAQESFQAALAADPTCETAIRALAAAGIIDLPAALGALADACEDGIRASLARVEGAIRLGEYRAASQWIEQAIDDAPALPIAAFIGERMARRAGEATDALSFVRSRRIHADDRLERALLSIREALMVISQDGHAATECLREAHEARPADVALRDLYERTAVVPPIDSAAWAASRAAIATGALGTSHAVVSLVAAYECEWRNDVARAATLAAAAAASGSLLARVVVDRTEIRAENFGRLTDEWIQTARNAADPVVRREACERLAALDAGPRHDEASGLLWHRAILEDFPEHKASLRFVEHEYIRAGRHADLEPIATAIATTLASARDAECAAHAALAGRLRRRALPLDRQAARDMIDLASANGRATLWSLRQLLALGRDIGDSNAVIAAARQLAERASRRKDRAVLLMRAGEAAESAGNAEEACAAFERAAKDDPGDVLALRNLASVKDRVGDARGAAEAYEALARCAATVSHRLQAWDNAARIWSDTGNDHERALSALRAAAAIDPDYSDVFDRLASAYGTLGMSAELAELLRSKSDRTQDQDERRALEVRRGHVLIALGDAAEAKAAFESALAVSPDNLEALSRLADLYEADEDWERAEQALVRLGRLLASADGQLGTYRRLANIYSNRLLNFPRAEVALKEVLKRAPDDVAAAKNLVDVFKQQGDATRAIEVQEQLFARATAPEDKRNRALELAALQENVARDARSAEKTFEAARRELPQDFILLQAMVAFYQRHRQTPAIKILLDRVASDARRTLSAGQIAPGTFELIAGVMELRGRSSSAAAARAMLSAVQGRSAELPAAAERAFDPQLDELVAPETFGPALRALLTRAGDALDGAATLNLRDLRATPMRPDAVVCRRMARIAAAAGLNGLQVYVSAKLGYACLPVASSPPAIILGEAATADERTCLFLAVRALKLVRAKASVFARLSGGDLSLLVGAWLKCFNPAWQPAWIPAATLQQAVARIRASSTNTVDPQLGALALEVTGSMQTQAKELGVAALAWADRVALLALGDPLSALDAIAASTGMAPAPRDAPTRALWVSHSAEARDLMLFAVSDAVSQVYARLGLER